MTRPPSSNPSQQPPLLPLQLGQLTSQLHNLHSSSTHSLDATTYSNSQKQSHHLSVKSLQDLDKFISEETSLDAYTEPTVSLTKEGKGAFKELFLPPPILPLPSVKKKKKKPALQSGSWTSSPSGRDKSPKTGSRTQSPNLPKSRSNTPPSLPQSRLKQLTQSHTSLPPPSLTSSTKSMAEVEEQSLSQDAPVAVSSQSKAAQKLLQKRARFCTPGNANTCSNGLIKLPGTCSYPHKSWDRTTLHTNNVLLTLLCGHLTHPPPPTHPQVPIS